jgi:uncharacterized protein (TIGR02466 family)
MLSNLQHLFTTPVCVSDWTALEEEAGQLGFQLMNSYFDNLQTLESNIFKRQILETAKEYAISTGKDSGYVHLNRVWCRIIKDPAYYVPPHVHSGTWAVGTFYFTAGQGDLVLLDPRGAHDFNYTQTVDETGQKYSNCTDHYYTPQALHAIFFPAYLKHMVLPSKENTRARMALSWNLEWWPRVLREVDQSRLINISN